MLECLAQSTTHNVITLVKLYECMSGICILMMQTIKMHGLTVMVIHSAINVSFA